MDAEGYIYNKGVATTLPAPLKASSPQADRLRAAGFFCRPHPFSQRPHAVILCFCSTFAHEQAGFRVCLPMPCGRTRIHPSPRRFKYGMHSFTLSTLFKRPASSRPPAARHGHHDTDTTQRTPRLYFVCPLRSSKATVICYTRPLCLPIIYSARVRFH